MHINYDEVAVLAKEFKLKYNRELIGKNMSQFHIYFEMYGANDDIYATACFFLGKKCTTTYYIAKTRMVMLSLQTISECVVFRRHVSHTRHTITLAM